jgi:hypothetical protein
LLKKCLRIVLTDFLFLFIIYTDDT